MWPFKKHSERKPLDLLSVKVQPFDNGICTFNAFDCGAEPLNKFLKGKVRRSTERREYNVRVAILAGSPACVGYYALQLGSDAVPDERRFKQSYLKTYTAFPAVHLSYLAVEGAYQRQGLGKHLLMDVFERVAQISENAGFYALTLQAFDENAVRFYKNLGFVEYADGPQPKMLYPLANILKTVRPD